MKGKNFCVSTSMDVFSTAKFFYNANEFSVFYNAIFYCLRFFMKLIKDFVSEKKNILKKYLKCFQKKTLNNMFKNYFFS